MENVPNKFSLNFSKFLLKFSEKLSKFSINFPKFVQTLANFFQITIITFIQGRSQVFIFGGQAGAI